MHDGKSTCQSPVQGYARRAKEDFYWPDIHKKIAEFISTCNICNSYKTEQQKESSVCRKIPVRPCPSISADQFQLKGTSYLVTTDSDSYFFELDILLSTTARPVINKLKPHLAIYSLDSPHTTTHSSTVLSFKRLQLIISLNILKRLHGILNATERLRKVSKFPKIMLENVANASHDPHLSLLDFRNTPSEGMDSTPQQRASQVEPVPHYPWLATCCSQTHSRYTPEFATKAKQASVLLQQRC